MVVAERRSFAEPFRIVGTLGCVCSMETVGGKGRLWSAVGGGIRTGLDLWSSCDLKNSLISAGEVERAEPRMGEGDFGRDRWMRRSFFSRNSTDWRCTSGLE